MAQHQDGSFEGYTSSRRPVTLVFSQEFSDINDAIRAERQIKGWLRKKKEALIAGNFSLLHELAECKNRTHYLRHGERSRTMTSPASHPSTSLRVTAPLERLNVLAEALAIEELTRCCGSSRWVQRMLGRRPFQSKEELIQSADDEWYSLSESDWKEAFTHHPKIGNSESLRKQFASTASWASSEQSGAANAREETLKDLAEGNRMYEERFGYIFIVCATGKSADEMLAILKSRLSNSPEDEIKIAAAEQAQITQLRLEKLFNNSKPEPRTSNPEP